MSNIEIDLTTQHCGNQREVSPAERLSHMLSATIYLHIVKWMDLVYSQGALVTFNTNLLRKGLTLRLYLGVW